MKISSRKDAMDSFIYVPVYDHLLNSRTQYPKLP